MIQLSSDNSPGHWHPNRRPSSRDRSLNQVQSLNQSQSQAEPDVDGMLRSDNSDPHAGQIAKAPTSKKSKSKANKKALKRALKKQESILKAENLKLPQQLEENEAPNAKDATQSIDILETPSKSDSQNEPEIMTNDSSSIDSEVPNGHRLNETIPEPVKELTVHSTLVSSSQKQPLTSQPAPEEPILGDSTMSPALAIAVQNNVAEDNDGQSNAVPAVTAVSVPAAVADPVPSVIPFHLSFSQDTEPHSEKEPVIDVEAVVSPKDIHTKLEPVVESNGAKPSESESIGSIEENTDQLSEQSPKVTKKPEIDPFASTPVGDQDDFLASISNTYSMNEEPDQPVASIAGLSESKEPFLSTDQDDGFFSNLGDQSDSVPQINTDKPEKVEAATTSAIEPSKADYFASEPDNSFFTSSVHAEGSGVAASKSDELSAVEYFSEDPDISFFDKIDVPADSSTGKHVQPVDHSNSTEYFQKEHSFFDGANSDTSLEHPGSKTVGDDMSKSLAFLDDDDDLLPDDDFLPDDEPYTGSNFHIDTQRPDIQPVVAPRDSFPQVIEQHSTPALQSGPFFSTSTQYKAGNSYNQSQHMGIQSAVQPSYTGHGSAGKPAKNAFDLPTGMVHQPIKRMSSHNPVQSFPQTFAPQLRQQSSVSQFQPTQSMAPFQSPLQSTSQPQNVAPAKPASRKSFFEELPVPRRSVSSSRDSFGHEQDRAAPIVYTQPLQQLPSHPPVQQQSIQQNYYNEPAPGRRTVSPIVPYNPYAPDPSKPTPGLIAQIPSAGGYPVSYQQDTAVKPDQGLPYSQTAQPGGLPISQPDRLYGQQTQLGQPFGQQQNIFPPSQKAPTGYGPPSGYGTPSVGYGPPPDHRASAGSAPSQTRPGYGPPPSGPSQASNTTYAFASPGKSPKGTDYTKVGPPLHQAYNSYTPRSPYHSPHGSNTSNVLYPGPSVSPPQPKTYPQPAGSNKSSTSYGDLPTNIARGSVAQQVTKNSFSSSEGRIAHDVRAPSIPIDNEALNKRQFPIFRWSGGNKVVAVIPPPIAYGASIISQVRINVINVNSVLSMDPMVSNFPGPLVSPKGPIKSKKKEAEKWLSFKIASLEQQRDKERNSLRLEHKILLFRVVKVLLETDPTAITTSSPTFLQSLRSILNPQIPLKPTNDLVNFRQASDIYHKSISRGNSIDTGVSVGGIPSAVFTELDLKSLVSNIEMGERENALRIALDNRLWTHALIIASSLGPSQWTTAVAEFVRNEIALIPNSSAEDLALCYKLFSGAGSDICKYLRLIVINKVIVLVTNFSFSWLFTSKCWAYPRIIN